MEILEIFSTNLPVGEKFSIKKARFSPTSQEKNQKRISIVTGIHGDELEGQFVVYLLADWLKKNQDKIRGIIDLYPAINSLGIDSITRSFPVYEVDLNRAFPGDKTSVLPSHVVYEVSQDVKGSDIAIDIHSSNIFLKEIPQIRINKQFANTIPLAKELNCDFIWVHDAVTVLEATFSHTMNELGTKTLVVEMGVGMTLTQKYGYQLLDGILNLMKKEGIIETEEVYDVREPFTSEVGDVYFLNAEASGLFIQEIKHCEVIKKGDKIGQIVDPLTGDVKCEVIAPNKGILFTLREFPVVYEGSLLARIFGEKDE
ncbi:MAG: M14 family metallopeptidase [Sulfurimonas sp.]|jgi:uncharacterized protein